MSHERRVASTLAQSWAKPSTTPNPPVTSYRFRMAATRSSGVPTTAAPAELPPATWSSSAHGSSTRTAPGRPRIPTLYSLCHRCRPRCASWRACWRVSARCHDSSTRQLARSTTWPCSAAAASAKAHWVGSAARPSDDVEAMDSTPQPCLPASCMPDGDSDDAVAMGMRSCSGRICSWASRSVNQSDSCEKRSSPRSRRSITPIASSCRSRCTIGSMPSVWASDGSAPGPEPKMTRPRVMWSSCTSRCATLNGWW